MMLSSVRRLLSIAALSVSVLSSQAQSAVTQIIKKETRPYQVFTAGKQITIKSSKNIQQIMVWTTNGHRVVEQREINSLSFTFKIPINEKIYFMMVGLEGEKIYTEKIGLRD